MVVLVQAAFNYYRDTAECISCLDPNLTIHPTMLGLSSQQRKYPFLSILYPLILLSESSYMDNTLILTLTTEIL